jgi:hypothetical protein
MSASNQFENLGFQPSLSKADIRVDPFEEIRSQTYLQLAADKPAPSSPPRIDWGSLIPALICGAPIRCVEPKPDKGK